MADLGAERSHASVLAAAVGRIQADAAERGIDRSRRRCARLRDRRGRVASPSATSGSAASATCPRSCSPASATPRSAICTGSSSGAPGEHEVRYSGLAAGVLVRRAPPPQVRDAGRDRRRRAGRHELLATPVPRPLAEVRGNWTNCSRGRRRPPADAGSRSSSPTRSGRPRRWSGCVSSGRTPSSSISQPEGEPVAGAAADLARLRQQDRPGRGLRDCSSSRVDSTLPDRRQRARARGAVEAAPSGPRRNRRGDRSAGVRLHRLRLRAFGPFAGRAADRLRPLGARRAVPARGPDRRGQDDGPRRDHVRPVRRPGRRGRRPMTGCTRTSPSPASSRRSRWSSRCAATGTGSPACQSTAARSAAAPGTRPRHAGCTSSARGR